jgi:DNA topoisomerase-1
VLLALLLLLLLLLSGEGLITYMRTDGANLSPAAVDSLREVIASQFGSNYLPASGPRVYKSRAKNAQEAHEAIRPTDPSVLPLHLTSQLSADQVNCAQRVSGDS